MTAKKKEIHCPTCGKPNTWVAHNVFRPFCSDRCKLIDLGEWASERHRIPTEEKPTDENGSDRED